MRNPCLFFLIPLIASLCSISGLFQVNLQLDLEYLLLQRTAASTLEKKACEEFDIRREDFGFDDFADYYGLASAKTEKV